MCRVACLRLFLLLVAAAAVLGAEGGHLYNVPAPPGPPAPASGPPPVPFKAQAALALVETRRFGESLLSKASDALAVAVVTTQTLTDADVLNALWKDNVAHPYPYVHLAAVGVALGLLAAAIVKSALILSGSGGGATRIKQL